MLNRREPLRESRQARHLRTFQRQGGQGRSQTGHWMSFGDLSEGTAPIHLHLVVHVWLVSQTSRQRANQFRLNYYWFRNTEKLPCSHRSEILTRCRGGSLQISFVLFNAFFESSNILQKSVGAQAKEVITEIWILIEDF